MSAFRPRGFPVDYSAWGRELEFALSFAPRVRAGTLEQQLMQVRSYRGTLREQELPHTYLMGAQFAHGNVHVAVLFPQHSAIPYTLAAPVSVHANGIVPKVSVYLLMAHIIDKIGGLTPAQRLALEA